MIGPAIIPIEKLICQQKHAPKYLLESIKSQGLVVPLTVRIKKSKFQVIDGRRRFACLKKLGIKAIACVVVEMTGEQMKAWQAIKSAHRIESTKEELGNAVQRLIDKGKTLKEIAFHTGRSESTLRRWLKCYHNRGKRGK